MASVTFDGTVIWDQAAGGVAASAPVFEPIGQELEFYRPGLGDGEWTKELGRAGANGRMTLVYRVAATGVPALVATLEGLLGGTRGTLVTPHGSWAKVSLLGAPYSVQAVWNESTAGRLVTVELVMRRSK
jgi:hypothetical protein